MGWKRFDRKFGRDFLRELPSAPGVYLFKDADGRVLYAGKALDVRRRLRDYRNATRRKAHRKMRRLVREADSLEVRLQESERAALLLENELIRTLRPRYNVDGTWAFLYPALGFGAGTDRWLLAFTTSPEAWQALGLTWYGAFRSRLRAREGFRALTNLLGWLGHKEPYRQLPRVPPRRGAQLQGYRRVPEELRGGLARLLAGESDAVLAELAARLLEKPAARGDAARVEECLRTLADFHRSDLAPLGQALRAAGRTGSFVPREERDALFLATRGR